MLGDALSAEGVAAPRRSGPGTCCRVFFTDDEVHDYAGAQAAQTWRFPPFFHALLDRGVYPPPSAFEAWFVSTALDDDAWSAIDDALPHAAKAAATARSPTDARSDGGDAGPAAPAPSSTCCATARCTTPSGVLYGRIAGFRLSETRPRPGRRRREGARRRRPAAVLASPLQRAQETAAPVADRARPRRSSPTTG